MAYITKYGSTYGTLPENTGRIFYVAPSAAGGGTANTATYQIGGQSFSASDDNDGLSPERAVASIKQALLLVRTPTSPSSPSTGTSAAVGTLDDTIVLLPGTHYVDNNNASASAAVNSGRLVITGVPGSAARRSRPNLVPRTTVTATAAVNLFTVTANDIEFAHLRFVPITAKTSVTITGARSRIWVHDSLVDMLGTAASTSTKGFVGVATVTNMVVERCAFLVDAAQGPCVDLTGTRVSALYDCLINQMAGTYAVAVQVGAATDTCTIQGNVFSCTTAGSMTVGIDGTGSIIDEGVHIVENRFGAIGRIVKAVGNFDATTRVSLTLNYQGSVGGGAGGALVTVAL